MVNYGLDFTKSMEGFQGSYGYRAASYVFKSAWNIPIIIFAGAFAIFSSVLASISPSKMAVKKTIAEAFRFE